MCERFFKNTKLFVGSGRRPDFLDLVRKLFGLLVQVICLLIFRIYYKFCTFSGEEIC